MFNKFVFTPGVKYVVWLDEKPTAYPSSYSQVLNVVRLGLSKLWSGEIREISVRGSDGSHASLRLAVQRPVPADVVISAGCQVWIDRCWAHTAAGSPPPTLADALSLLLADPYVDGQSPVGAAVILRELYDLQERFGGETCLIDLPEPKDVAAVG